MAETIAVLKEQVTEMASQLAELKHSLVYTVSSRHGHWTWVHFYQPNPTHQIHTQPNPTHFMLLADPTEPIKLVLL